MKARLAAFQHAFRGACTLVRSQAHAKFHALATAGVLVLAILLRLSRLEWALLVIAIAMVWLAEALNTAIEYLADEVTLEWRERLKHAKDVAAFAVLAASFGAALVGVLVLGPHVKALF